MIILYACSKSSVGASNFIIPSHREFFIALAHQMVRNDLPNQNESLALYFQLMGHSEIVHLTPSCCTNSEGALKKALAIEGTSYPLDFDGRKMHDKIPKHTP